MFHFQHFQYNNSLAQSNLPIFYVLLSFGARETPSKLPKHARVAEAQPPIEIHKIERFTDKKRQRICFDSAITDKCVFDY